MELMILKALLIIIPLGMAAVVLWYVFYVGSYIASTGSDRTEHENDFKKDSCATDENCDDSSRKPGNE